MRKVEIMKRFVALVLFFGVLVISLSAQASITRFAVVDMNRLIALYTDKAALNAYNEKRDRVQVEIERHSNELKELNAKLEEAKGKKKNTKQIKALENEIAAKTQTVKTYIDTMMAELENDREQLQKKVNMTQIKNAIRFVAEAEGYSMVLSKEGDSVIWYSPSVDITIKVINRLTGKK